MSTASYRKTRVYIAGPYTKPDPCINTHEALEIAEKLMVLGYVPFVPHLCHFWHTVSPHPYDVWAQYVMEFLNVCDVVLRLPGESAGADAEVAVALVQNIPVVYSIEELYTYYSPTFPFNQTL